MKKKNYAENSEEDNEFDIDEPEEIQNNASDDDWTPDKDNSGGRRTSSRLRNFPPRARAPIIDASSTEEEGSDHEGGGSKRKSKGKGRGRQPVKKQKVSSTSTPAPKKIHNVSKTVSSDSEPSSTTTTTTTTTITNSSGSPSAVKVSKDFTSGAFIVLKTDVEKDSEDPPLWKIDGKALLQKYIAFEQDGKTLYKNTSVYSGWTINNKDNYYPVSVIFKQQTRKEHIVEFNRSQIKKLCDGEVVSSSVPESPAGNLPEKPVIKVKSFATVPDEESKTPAKPLVEKLPQTPNETTPNTIIPPTIKYNKDFASGSFLVSRSEAANVDPPLWKIDGKSLLQKYCAFHQDGKVLYKNTAEYSGWSLNSRKEYFSVNVAFKQQDKKDHIVQLLRIKWDEPDDEAKDD